MLRAYTLAARTGTSATTSGLLTISFSFPNAAQAETLSRDYLRPALKAPAITKPFRPCHDLRHTSLTHEAAAGNPQAYVQPKAGHSQGTITDRYIHASQVLFPGAAAHGEARMFGPAGSKTGSKPRAIATLKREKPRVSGAFL